MTGERVDVALEAMDAAVRDEYIDTMECNLYCRCGAPNDAVQKMASEILALRARVQAAEGEKAEETSVFGKYGNCPVQGYAFVDGWLCYFRARDGWTFSAWSPGSFERVPARLYMSEAETTLIDCERKDGFSYWNPDFLIEDDLSCPDPGDDENAYPGWWSLAYASKIIYWCVDKLRQHIEQRATDS